MERDSPSGIRAIKRKFWVGVGGTILAALGVLLATKTVGPILTGDVQTQTAAAAQHAELDARHVQKSVHAQEHIIIENRVQVQEESTKAIVDHMEKMSDKIDKIIWYMKKEPR